MAFYLKYRSQTVNDLDIRPVRQALTQILSAPQLPHAFLFSGPKGTGKTSAARILAKAVNCEKRIGEQKTQKAENPKSRKPKDAKNDVSGPRPSTHGLRNPEPCNSCPHCLSITAGSNLDVIEMDAASHRGIDDIRDLRERINLAPTDSRYRVYIIDEVHMLTTEAFNALLKTLEEPPAHAIFILCTTEVHKLPDTIVSRCNQVKFRKANQSEVLRSLDRVVTGENLQVDRSALQLIAKAADGSFRDAHKFLEQLSLSGQSITTDIVQQQLGTLSSNRVIELLDLFHQRDIKGALNWIEARVSEGTDLTILLRLCLEQLHQGLLIHYGLPAEDDDAQGLASWPLSEIQQLTQTLSQAAQATPTAAISQLPLEIAAANWCQTSPGKTPKEKPGVSLGAPSPTPKPHTSSSKSHPDKSPDPKASSPAASANLAKNLDPAAKDSGPPSPSDSVTTSALSSTNNSPPPSDLSFQVISDQWAQVLAAVKPKNHSVEGLLRATRPQSLDGSDLILEVFYEFHLNQLKLQAKRILVEQALQEVFNHHLNLIFRLGQRPKPAPRSRSTFSPPQYTQKPPASSSASLKPSPLAPPDEQEQDLAAIAAEIFGA
jgi:DNA polymerase-3 subunit gamma/tau